MAVTGFRGIPASWGGIEHRCEQLYSRLAAKGFQITVFARNRYVKEDIHSYKGVRIKRLPTIEVKGLEAFFHTFLAVLYILIDNPDIIHIHAQGPSLFSWMPRLFRPKMRVFFTCHGLDWQRRKWSRLPSWIIYLGEICSALFPHYHIVVSKELQRYYQMRYGVSAHYIPNGVQKPPKRSPQLIKEYGLSERGYFLFVGRIVPEKRVEDIIKAYLMKPHRAKLVIVGDASGTEDYIRDLKGMAKDHPSVLFVGFQYGDALEEFFSNARAYVTASELEGLPLTLLEALSHGLTCITSDIPPHREVMEKLGFLMFPTGDQSALSERMNYVETLSDSEMDAMGKKAAARVYEEYNWDRLADKLGLLYQNSLQSRS